MSKSIISYSFFFYSMYRFCATKIGGRREFPQIWAVAYMCFWGNVVFLTLDMLLKYLGIPNLSSISLLSSFTLSQKYIFVLVCITLFNFYFFFSRKRWFKYVGDFDQISSKLKMKGYVFVSFSVLVIFIFQLAIAYLSYL